MVTLYHGTTEGNVRSIEANGVDRQFNTTPDIDWGRAYGLERYQMEERANGLPKLMTIRLPESVLQAMLDQGVVWKAQLNKWSSAEKYVFEQGSWATLNSRFGWGQQNANSGGC